MRVKRAIVAVVIGLAFIAIPIAHAFAAFDSHASYTQLGQDPEEATPALVAVCCPTPDLPAAGTVVPHVLITSISWNLPADTRQNGRRPVPEPPPPRL